MSILTNVCDTKIEIRCPTRIDFTGGFTDVSPFRNGTKAIHVNAAINLYINMDIKLRRDQTIVIYSPLVKNPQKFKAIHDLLKNSHYKFIGKILNKFPLSSGIEIRTNTEAPMGSGLGSSGSFGTALVAACHILSRKSNVSDYGEIANLASELENKAGFLGGKQDQFAASFGGINRFEFFKNSWKVCPILINNNIKKIEEYLIIAHRGGSRKSSDIVRAVFSKYRNSKDVRSTLWKLNNLAFEIEIAIRNSDLENLVKLFNNVRTLQERLHPRIVNKTCKSLIKKMYGLNVGLKMLGGGGKGACFLIVSATKKSHVAAQKILKMERYVVIPVCFAKTGLRIKIY